MLDSTDNLTSKNPASAGLDLRHLNAFQQVYVTRDFTLAGHDLNTNRKGIVRMIGRLEQIFQSPLFTPQTRGTLNPSPFADRLYNDLRFLNSAREALMEQVTEIRESGRLLRVGSSPSVFRSEIFRTLFRSLQTNKRIRTSYVPVKAGDAGKALASGTCDIHLGCAPPGSARYHDEIIGEIGFQKLRKTGGATESVPQPPCLVTLDDYPPSSAEPLAAYPPLDETRFLHWLDHPEDCPDGTCILAPDLPRDGVHWHASEAPLEMRQTIRVQYLRQHPYEFLPALVKSLQSQMSE